MMSVVIALIGIINTLSLAIIERRRELGLLRIVGMTDDLVQRMIRIESLLIAALGTLTGVVLGLFTGWAPIHAIDRLTNASLSFSVPYGTIALVLVLGVVLGVLAALLPRATLDTARRPGCAADNLFGITYLPPLADTLPTHPEDTRVSAETRSSHDFDVDSHGSGDRSRDRRGHEALPASHARASTKARPDRRLGAGDLLSYRRGHRAPSLSRHPVYAPGTATDRRNGLTAHVLVAL